MKLVRTLAAPKEGNADDEYEDAFAAGAETVVVCDGASAAVYARDWAQLLAEAFVDAPFPDKDEAFWGRVSELGATWRKAVGGEDGQKRAWYAEEKLPQGSAASLLAVTIAQGRWQARALGDVCCFLIRDDRLRYAFPLTKSRQFGSRPALVPTDPARMKKRPALVRFAAPWEEGDRLLVMTDALACWFLTEFEAKRRPWRELPESEAALTPWLATRRASGAIKNDDVTLVEVTGE